MTKSNGVHLILHMTMDSATEVNTESGRLNNYFFAFNYRLSVYTREIINRYI